MNKADAE
jgi:hypothetical protein